MKLLGLQYDVAIAGPDPHHEPNDAGQTVNETSAENRVAPIAVSFVTQGASGVPQLHSISSTIMAFTLIISHMRGTAK